MENYRCQKSYTPKTRSEQISDTVEFPPKKFHMPHMSSMDATYNATQYIICTIQNPSPASPLVKLGNGNREALKTLADIFRKANPLAVPPRVPVRDVSQKKLQEMNQEVTQMKRAPQSKPITNAEPLSVPIVEA